MKNARLSVQYPDKNHSDQKQVKPAYCTEKVNCRSAVQRAHRLFGALSIRKPQQGFQPLLKALTAKMGSKGAIFLSEIFGLPAEDANVTIQVGWEEFSAASRAFYIAYPKGISELNPALRMRILQGVKQALHLLNIISEIG